MNKVAVIIGLIAGCFLLLYWGGEAPPWLLKIECAGVMAAALFFAYSAYSPSAPEWLRHDAVRGVALVYLGIGAMFIDPRVLISAFLIGSGCKLVMRTAAPAVQVWGGKPLGHTGDLVIRESTPLEPIR